MPKNFEGYNRSKNHIKKKIQQGFYLNQNTFQNVSPIFRYEKCSPRKYPKKIYIEKPSKNTEKTMPHRQCMKKDN